MKLYAIALLCATLAAIPFVAQKREAAAKGQVRILAVAPTPQPETVATIIQLPQETQVIRNNPVWVQVRLNGYALASDSQFNRAGEVANSELGQTMHVVVDNLPYFPVNGPSIEPFNENGWYYNQNYKFELPCNLEKGFHTLRIFTARSFGESLKGEHAFHDSYFFLGERDDSSKADILTQPYLTYNEPSDQFYLVENKPVLLDFYIRNTELSPDGYKVRVTLDHHVQRTLTSWQPYYIYGLAKGRHTVRLELLDPEGLVAPGPFNDISRHFVVH